MYQILSLPQHRSLLADRPVLVLQIVVDEAREASRSRAPSRLDVAQAGLAPRRRSGTGDVKLVKLFGLVEGRRLAARRRHGFELSVSHGGSEALSAPGDGPWRCERAS